MRRSRSGGFRWRVIGPLAVFIALAVVVAVGLASPNREASIAPQAPTSMPVVDAARARELLQAVPVKGRAPKTGYRRDRFGNGWPTVGGCDVRNRILARDLTAVIFRPATQHCVVASGTLHDPYTGRSITFVRGERTSSKVQIDHRYALLLSWQQGAQQWDQATRERFASDPANLVAVAGEVNEAKGAAGPGSWLPPNRAYRCRYVIDFVSVASHYDLSMNPGDHSAAEKVLARC